MRVASSTAAAGDYRTAVALYRRAHTIAPMQATPLTGLGRALSALGAHEDAAEAYRKALALSPDDPNILHGLGNSMIALDQPAAAISHFELMLAGGELPAVYNGLGVAHDMLGRHTEAQAFYRTGLKGAPSDMRLRNNLGLSLALSNRFDEAIEILQRLAGDPRAGSQQRLNLALVYGLSGDGVAAAEIARIDLDESAVRRNLSYYRTLRALNDPKATLRAVGAGSVAPTDFPNREGADPGLRN
jgi:Flp pilus assembly protein TadD